MWIALNLFLEIVSFDLLLFFVFPIVMFLFIRGLIHSTLEFVDNWRIQRRYVGEPFKSFIVLNKIHISVLSLQQLEGKRKTFLNSNIIKGLYDVCMKDCCEG